MSLFHNTRHLLKTFLHRNTTVRDIFFIHTSRTCATSTHSSTMESTKNAKSTDRTSYNSPVFMKDNLTVAEMKQYFFLYMGLDRGYQPLRSSRAHLLPLLPESQDEMPIRKMSDSYSTVTIPLKDDKELQEKYVAMTGNLRLGRLLEEMDTFAVWVAYKHILNPRQKPEDDSPYVIVTLLVDGITFSSFQPKYDANVRLSGHVSWVGKSSIEVKVSAQQCVYGHWEEITSAHFLLAARNSTKEGPAIVNRLVPETEEEKKIFHNGEMRKKYRTQLQQASLLKVIPNAEEQRVIHDLFLRTVDMRDPMIHRRELPPGSMWMDEHIYNSIIFAHPEDRNMHDNVFGGFLMRNSLELAWMSACLYSKYRPKLLHINDVSFLKPIKVGSFINMHARVVYTQQNYIQIVVFADVLDPVTNATVTTNSFQYTFENPVEVFRILPRSYSDAMLFIDGRRHFQHVMGLVPRNKM